MNEKKNIGNKLKTNTKQIIDDVLNFCSYYGVIVNTDNISITFDNVLILKGIDKTSLNIITDNLALFIINVFSNNYYYVQQYDINIINTFDSSYYYEKDDILYNETYECKFEFVPMWYLVKNKMRGKLK